MRCLKSLKEAFHVSFLCCSGQAFPKNFIFPMSKTNKKLGGHLVPRAEIDKIINVVNILREVGDIDVLAFDKIKNQIILFEFKLTHAYFDGHRIVIV